MKKLLLSILFISSMSLTAFSQDLSLCASPIIDGNNVELQIKTTGFTNIGGFQFAVAWELSKLNFDGIGNENTDLPGLAYNQIDDHQTIGIGVLRSLWVHSGGLSETLDEESTIYSIFFTADDPSDIGTIGIVPHNEFPIEIVRVEGADVFTIDPVINNTGCNTLSILAFTTDVSDTEIVELNVYPNPVADFLEIQSEDFKDGVIEIYNAQGKLVQSQEIQNNNRVILNVQTLHAGYYNIRYSDVNRSKMYHAKFVKI